MALAVQVAFFALLWPFVLTGADTLVIYVPVLLSAATPLVFAHRLIVRKDPPYLRRGYWVVALYGPVILIGLFVTGAGSDPMTGLLIGAAASVIYQVGALAALGAYVVLWRLGDRWFGDIEHPRVGRRWALAAVAAVAVSLYAPFTWRAIQWDACVDRGGSYRPGGWCNFDPTDTANNGPWPTD